MEVGGWCGDVRNWRIDSVASIAMRKYIAKDFASSIGKVVGNGQCVMFVKEVAVTPASSLWSEGDKVRGNKSLKPGTAIATFQDGKYRNSTGGDSHAAIYVAQDGGGIVVVDQWKNQPVHSRYIPFKGGTIKPHNDGDAFSVVIGGDDYVGESLPGVIYSGPGAPSMAAAPAAAPQTVVLPGGGYPVPWYGGYGYGSPWYNVGPTYTDPLYTVSDGWGEEEPDVDAIAEAVAQKLALKGVKVSGLDMLGADMGDPNYINDAIAEFKGRLNKTPITFSVAKTIADSGLDMTQQAEDAIKKGSILGPAFYQNPRGHLQWHVAAIKKEIKGQDPKTIPYTHMDDLRKWAVEAYRAMFTANVEQQQLTKIRQELYADLVSAISEIPHDVVQTITKIPGAIVEGVTGVPIWAWSVMGVGAAGALGYGVYRIVRAVGPAAARVAVNRYLP